MRQVKSENDLASECRILQQLELRAPEIGVVLAVDNELIGLEDARRFLLNSDDRLALIDCACPEALDCHGGSAHQYETQNQPLSLEDDRQIILEGVRVVGRNAVAAIGLAGGQVRDRPVQPAV